jgi:hypothetical protein
VPAQVHSLGHQYQMSFSLAAQLTPCSSRRLSFILKAPQA